MYCPTPGRASICPRSLGNLPLRFAISVARLINVLDRLRQSPTGRMRAISSSSFAVAIWDHDRYRARKVGKNWATVSARVLWSRTLRDNLVVIGGGPLPPGETSPMLPVPFKHSRSEVMNCRFGKLRATHHLRLLPIRHWVRVQRLHDVLFKCQAKNLGYKWRHRVARLGVARTLVFPFLATSSIFSLELEPIGE